MKQILFSVMMSLTSLQLYAAPEDHGRVLDDGESSGSDFGILFILVIAGVIIYNIFKQDGKEDRGCIAVIIAAILLFIIVYAINH